MTLQDLYETLLPNKATLDKISDKMADNHSALSACSSLELRRYDSGEVIEAYVEAELKNGQAVTWWADIRSEAACWTLDVRISATDALGQVVLRQFPEQHTEHIETIKTLFEEALKDISCLDDYATALLQRTVTTEIAVG